MIPVYITDTQGDSLCSADLLCTSDGYSYTSPFGPLLVYYSSSDTTVATIDPIYGTVNFNKVGHVTFYASAWVFGVARRDSLRFTITHPLGRSITVDSVVQVGSTTPTFFFHHPLDTIAVGGTIAFLNSTLHPVDVVFDDSTAITGGNIPPFEGYIDNKCYPVPAGGCHHPTLVGRSFPTAGTYTYHSTLIGAGGKIVVTQGP